MHTVEQREDAWVKRARWEGVREGNLVEISRAIQRIVDRYARAHLAPAEELRQEAWRVGLEAAQKWDLFKGGKIGPYVELALSTEVARAISRQRCHFTLSKGAATVGVGYAIEEAAKEERLRVGRRFGEDLERLGDDDLRPDTALERGAREQRLEGARERRRVAYKRAAARLPPPLREFAEAFMARVWLGHEVPDPGKLALELDICTPAQARRAMLRMRRALREDPEIMEAMDAYEEMREAG